MIRDSLSISWVKLPFLATSVLLAWTLYDATHRDIEYLETTPRELLDTNATEKRSITTTGNYDVNRIVAAHLFGKPKENEPVTAKITKAPETRLRLSLAGMISSSDHEWARAFIKLSNGQLRGYRVGDLIEGTDATLHAVSESQVLIDRSGALESLALDRAQLN